MQRLLLVTAISAMAVAVPVETAPPGSEAQQRLMREEPKGEAWEHVTISSKGLHSFAELSQDGSDKEDAASQATAGEDGDKFVRKRHRSHDRSLAKFRHLLESNDNKSVAEVVCPWFFDINTNHDNKIKCYDGVMCDPITDKDKECCCQEHGGIYQCSREQPYMCRNKACGGTTHKCQASDDCSSAGGKRPCEGRPGKPGPSGHTGTTGEHGESGSRGHIGNPGTEGHKGAEGHEGKEGPNKVAPTADAAPKAMMLGVFFLNMLVALGVYAATNFQYKQMTMPHAQGGHHTQDHSHPVEAGG